LTDFHPDPQMFQSVSTWLLADLCDVLLQDKLQVLEENRNEKIVGKLISLVEYLPDRKLFNEISYQRIKQRTEDHSNYSRSSEKSLVEHLEKLVLNENTKTNSQYSITINSK